MSYCSCNWRREAYDQRKKLLGESVDLFETFWQTIAREFLVNGNVFAHQIWQEFFKRMIEVTFHIQCISDLFYHVPIYCDYTQDIFY